jgi:GntR family transcriptional regulator, vanillate catabolism transcriptional regulator
MPRGDSAQTVKATLGLRQLLFDGEIRPGERLVELSLVERLGVSRTPLRVALTTLEHEGLVVSLAGGGFTVREFTRSEIDDAIELRGVLEGTAARFAAERLESPAELDEIRGILVRLDAVVHDASAEAVLEYVELNEQFHELLVALSKSEIVARELVRVEAVPFASPSALLESHVESEQREILLIAQHQHRAMIEAIEQGHGARAEEVAREHARISQRSLDLALKRGDVIERLPGAPLLNLVD